MRGFFKDRDVREHKLTKDTRRRILQFARPYRAKLALFVGLIGLEAAAGAVTPLLFKNLIDNGITAGNKEVVIVIAAAVAALAIFSAGLSVADRWVSSQVGEGLILDLRTAVFDHVQSMPLAFFSRAKTGALVQRLNGDVLGAQQAFTSTLQSVVSNALTIVFVLAAMFSMSWQLTLLSLVLLPAFVLPARWFGKKIAKVTRESYELNADAAQIMNERFNVAGAHLVKIFGDPERESAAYGAQVSRVRDIGVTRALYSTWFRVGLTTLASVAVATVYGIGGVMAINGELTVGVVVALTAYLGRLYGPLTSMSNVQVDVMTALVSFERVLEVLDLEPTVAEKPDAADLTTAVKRARRVRHARPRRLPLPQRRRGLARLPRVRRDPGPRGARRHAHRRQLRGARGPHGRSRRPLGRGQDDDVAAGHAHVRPDARLREDRRHRPARRHAGLPARHGRRGQPGGPPLPRHDRGEPALRPPGGVRRGHPHRPARRRTSPTSWTACPTASRPSSATAATASRAASVSGWPSRACCSRPRTS